MKNYIIVFLLILTSGCNSDDISDKSKRNVNWAWWVDAETKKGMWIQVGKPNTAYNGRYTLFYFNGTIFKEGKHLNGKDVDTVFRYDTKGKLYGYQVINARDESIYYISDGSLITYYQDGKIHFNGMIKDHSDLKENGIRYFENGNIEIETKISNDTCWRTEYYENGKMKEVGFHLNDTFYSAKTWYENGKLKNATNWKDGLEDGEFSEYYSNGQIKRNGFNKKGKINGVCNWWYENGQFHGSMKYDNGHLNGILNEYYSNGQMKRSYAYKDGKKNGVCKEWYENGQLHNDMIAKDDKIVGKEIEYYENGQMKSFGIADNNSSLLEYKEFDIKGDVTSYTKNGVKLK